MSAVETPNKAPEPAMTDDTKAKLFNAAESLKKQVGQFVKAWISEKDLARQIAEVIYEVRQCFYAPQSGKDTAKGYAPIGVLLPDLGGRSTGYRDWVKDNVAALIASQVDDQEEADRIRDNLIRYHVQQHIKRVAESDKKVHATLVKLRMETATQSERQAEAAQDRDARNRANQTANGLVNATLVSESNEFGAKKDADGQPTVPVWDLATAVATYVTALHQRVTPEIVEHMGGEEKERMVALLSNVAEMLDKVTSNLSTEVAVAA